MSTNLSVCCIWTVHYIKSTFITDFIPIFKDIQKSNTLKMWNNAHYEDML